MEDCHVMSVFVIVSCHSRQGTATSGCERHHYTEEDMSLPITGSANNKQARHGMTLMM